MPWRWTEAIGTVIVVGVLDTLQGIVGIREWGTELGREEDWNMAATRTMNRGGLREKIDKIMRII